MSITINVLQNRYFSMKKKLRKIRIIFDIENWLWKSEIVIFRSLDLERRLIWQKICFMNKCYFSLNYPPIWWAVCWKNLKCYLISMYSGSKSIKPSSKNIRYFMCMNLWFYFKDLDWIFYPNWNGWDQKYFSYFHGNKPEYIVHSSNF